MSSGWGGEKPPLGFFFGHHLKGQNIDSVVSNMCSGTPKGCSEVKILGIHRHFQLPRYKEKKCHFGGEPPLNPDFSHFMPRA